MKPTSELAGKLLYSIVFIVLIPVFLWLWARYTSELIGLPAITSKTAGWIMIISGGLLMLWAMAALWRLGRGLPMNAYPPALFVTGGPYRLLRHPIYWGFAILMIGFFLLTGSASGLWLVSPLTILGMIALVLGYENSDLKKRFPDKTLRTLLDLSANKADVPEFSDRLISLCLVFPFLILCNFLIITSGGLQAPISGDSPQFFSVFQHSNLNLISLAFLAIIPFALKRKDILRKWEISVLLSLCYFLFVAILFPSIGAQHLTRDNVILLTVPVFLILISVKSLYNQSRRTAAIFGLAAIIPILIQLALSNSPLIYLVNSVIIFLLSAYYLRIWVFIKNIAEKIANSWQEWIFGKVRIINRGFYIAIGTFFGLLLAGYLAGREYVLVLLLFSVIVTITSGLWAQLIEGSAKLKRPFGFYGGLVGIIFGTLVIWALGYNAWVIIGVASVVMPWMQAVGRLGCLVNGCCHGSRVDDPLIGIRYFHPRSRVCNISGLKGELLHPTQLYSIVWLFFVGILLLNLWYNGVSCSFIFGLYLILTGMGRFVEESFRGEIQTPGIMGLRLYQWTAIISVAIGIIMTIIQIKPPEIIPGLGWESFFVAGFGGLFLFFAMGVDFPYSNARFSRLV